jgi:uncharacterized repeat protein (TIGR02543 family)
MDSDKTIIANFIPDPRYEKFKLSKAVNGKGKIKLNPKRKKHLRGTQVQITAKPRKGWVFTGWAGDLGGSVNPATIVMNGNKYVMASFSRQEPLINAFSVSPGTISEGAPGILVWNISHAKSATINPGIGTVDPERGSIEVEPNATTTYTLTATNPYGSDSTTTTLRVGPQIVDAIPHDGAGIQDNTQVPHDVSFEVQIFEPRGIDITNPDSIRFTVSDGTLTYERDLADRSVVSVTKLFEEPDTRVTELRVAYHRSGERRIGGYDFDQEIHIEIDVQGLGEDRYISDTFEFKTENAH